MKLSKAELRQVLEEARAAVPVGTRWNHYKGGVYQVTGHGFSANLEIAEVQYVRLAGPGYEGDESAIPFHRDVAEWESFYEGRRKWEKIA